MRQVQLDIHFTDEGAEVQRGETTYSRACSWYVAELGLEPKALRLFMLCWFLNLGGLIESLYCTSEDDEVLSSLRSSEVQEVAK